MNRRLFLQSLGAFITTTPGTTKATTETTPLSVAVVPQFSAIDIQKAWAPLLERVSARAGIALQLRTYPSIPKFEEDFTTGAADLAFMNPYHAVMARRAQKYIPLLRDGDKPLTGILVVPKGGSIKKVRDLDGRRIAFPAPNAFGASLYMRALLAEVHKIKFEAVYVKTHTNAFRHVLTESADAAGGIRSTLEREAPSVRDNLHVLYETPPAASHPLSAHPRITPAQREALRDAFLAEATTADGPELFRPTTITRPTAADYGRDYAPLERLNLNRYVLSE